MGQYKIYHNPRCRKSREGLQILIDNGIEPEIIEYLDTPPTVSELDKVLKMLGKEPEEIIRKNEDIFKVKFKGKTLKRDEWIQAMVENPKLIERPIVIRDSNAVLGRPPENIKDLL
ncbi:arsenate reductase (glutaredoxin) [Bacteroidota bacterium]